MNMFLLNQEYSTCLQIILQVTLALPSSPHPHPNWSSLLVPSHFAVSASGLTAQLSMPGGKPRLTKNERHLGHWRQAQHYRII